MMNNQMIHCPECQTEHPSDSRFCSKCGTQFGLSDKDAASFTKTLQTPMGTLFQGTTFADRYEVKEELGEGGMGHVYRVFDTKIKEEIALKLLKPDIASNKIMLERFSNELKFARKITHKNVCRMHDINEVGQTTFITMEYVEGEDLKSVIKRMGSLTVGNVLAVAIQVTDGLAEAHGLGIVHRDLKPQNIMIDKEGNAKIMDFGIARSVEGKGMTVEGMVIGTPEYMSPEQVEGRAADQRADIYALGVILYEMVTGEVPFSGDSAFSIALKHKSEEPLDPRKFNAQLPDNIVGLILRCMEKKAESRFQTAEELLSELLDVEKTLPEKERVAQKIMPRISVARAEKFSLKKVLVPALAAVVVVVAGIIAWRLMTPQQPIITDTGRPTLAILPVKNSTGDPGLDIWKENLQNMLISDMMQSKHLHVLDFSRMYSVLTRTDLLDAKNYTEDDLKDLADEAKATHIIQSSLIKAGENFRISATIMDTRTMNTIASEDADGKGEESFFNMVDSLTPKFKTHFNLTEEQIAKDLDASIEDVTTTNKRALQLYLEAIKFADAADPQQAAMLLEQAVAIDPDFAMAHWRLSRAYFGMVTHGMAGSEMKPKFYEAIQKAYEAIQHRNVSERERLLIEAFCGPEKIVMGNPKILEKLVDLYPEDTLANERLAAFFMEHEEYERAIDHLDLVIKNNTASSYAYLQRGQIYFHQGFNDKAKDIIELGLEKFPEAYSLNCFLPSPYAAEGRYDEALLKWENFFLSNPTLYKQCLRRGSILLLQEDFDAAEEEYRKMLTWDLEQAVWSGMINLLELYILQGRFDDAFAQIELAKEKWGEEDQQINSILGLMYMRRDNLERALEAAKFSHNSVAGSIYAKLNLWEKAEEVIGKYRGALEREEKRLGFTRKQTRRTYLKVLGIIEFERGNLALAIEYLEQAKSLFTGVHFGNYADFVENLALAYYKDGNLVRAAEEFELITTLTWGRINDGDIYAKSFYMLGKIYEELGKKGEARKNYERFLDLWKNADPGLPEVDDARASLGAL